MAFTYETAEVTCRMLLFTHMFITNQIVLYFQCTLQKINSISVLSLFPKFFWLWHLSFLLSCFPLLRNPFTVVYYVFRLLTAILPESIFGYWSAPVFCFFQFSINYNFGITIKVVSLQWNIVNNFLFNYRQQFVSTSTMERFIVVVDGQVCMN